MLLRDSVFFRGCASDSWRRPSRALAMARFTSKPVCNNKTSPVTPIAKIAGWEIVPVGSGNLIVLRYAKGKEMTVLNGCGCYNFAQLEKRQISRTGQYRPSSGRHPGHHCPLRGHRNVADRRCPVPVRPGYNAIW